MADKVVDKSFVRIPREVVDNHEIMDFLQLRKVSLNH